MRSEGLLAVNVMHFCRVLRGAGLPVGTGAVLDALRALTAIDVSRRDDMRACLAAVLVKRLAHRELFDQAFDAFFRDPFGAREAMALLLPRGPAPEEKQKGEVSRRVAEALRPTPADDSQERRPAAPPEEQPPEEVEVEATLTWSDRDVLGKKDFAEMSAEELEVARRAVSKIQLFDERVPSRRTRPDPRGRAVDLRATLRASLRSTGHDIPLRYRSRRKVAPPLVVLCDISGSMARYSEMLLRFLHAVVSGRRRVHTFLFGTRLTNVTRALRFRDVDVALRRCALEVSDWSGGTRIGATLREFNRAWSRRVLGQGALVLLITDGLDHEGGDRVGEETERLAKSCRRLVWLNPLLGYQGFEPRGAGIRALLPWVDEFRPVHNLDSLAELALALSEEAERDAVLSPLARRAAEMHARMRRLRR